MATAAAVIIAAAQRDLTGYFLAADAVRAADAVPFTPRRRLERSLFERMRRDGLVHEAEPGRWWFDVPAYHAQRQRRRKMGVVAAAVLTVGVALALLV